eukprot:c25825_g1_i1 orf=239-2530(+)
MIWKRGEAVTETRLQRVILQGWGTDDDRNPVGEDSHEELHVLGSERADSDSAGGDGVEQSVEDDADDEDGRWESGDEGEREIAEAMLEYMDASENGSAGQSVRTGRVSSDEKGNGGETREVIEGGSDGEGRDVIETVAQVEESDSSEDEVPPRNTIGHVPLEWYKDEEHIGYDIGGRKLKRKEKRDKLDSFLARSDDAKDWWKVYDEYNDEEVELTKEEVGLIMRLRQGKIPHAEVNPFEPYVDWFDWEDKGHPLSSAPVPKRRFVPSKWEAKKVVKLVRAIRKGWIKLGKPKEKPKYYLMWGDDLKTAGKTANGLAYIPAPKPNLPRHEESYHPPVEYIPTQEEINSYAMMYEEDRPKFIPKTFGSLRQVPAYTDFIKDRFERCLDLYLCPRSRKKRINIDPELLIPKLPKPKDLRPFPMTCYIEFLGHTGPVLSIAPGPSGEWIASGSSDGTARLWEVQTGRCVKVWDIGKLVNYVAWNPNSELSILAVAVEKEVLLLNTELRGESQSTMADLLRLKKQSLSPESTESIALVTWLQHEKFQGLQLQHQQVVQSVSWHYKGDYFASVAPDGNTKAVLMHQLSKQQTQNPFRKFQGSVVRVLFHPCRPFFFVATKLHVRVYNLAKQQLFRKLLTGLHEISSMAIHPAGDNLIVGSREGKLCWFDLDLLTKPYKTIKNHDQDIRAVAFHSSYPLFASCADDSTVHIFHGMVYSDLLQNPLIVPLKILCGHRTVNGRGILDCQFHPQQPWIFTAGADAAIKLFCN